MREKKHMQKKYRKAVKAVEIIIIGKQVPTWNIKFASRKLVLHSLT